MSRRFFDSREKEDAYKEGQKDERNHIRNYNYSQYGNFDSPDRAYYEGREDEKRKERSREEEREELRREQRRREQRQEEEAELEDYWSKSPC